MNDKEKLLKALYNASIGFWTNVDAVIGIAEELGLQDELELWGRVDNNERQRKN